MMAIKKIRRLLSIVIILLGNTILYAQQNEVQKADGYYSQFYMSNVHEIGPFREWVLIDHWNPYGLNKTEAVQLKTGTAEVLPKADKYSFTTSHKMLLFFAGKAVLFKNLQTKQKQEISGSFIVTVLQEIGKVVLYEKENKYLLICDNDGNILLRKNAIDGVRIHQYNNTLLATSEKKWLWLNISSFDQSVTEIEKPMEWYEISGNMVWGLSFQRSSFLLSEWNIAQKSVTQQEINLPSGYKVADDYPLYTETREDRYLILPLVKNASPQPDVVSISYSNKNNSNKLPFRQLAVYDLLKKEWVHLPRIEDLFYTQDFINDKGDFIQYDKVTANRDTLSNFKTQINLVKNYGEKIISLRNPYFNKANFKYDLFTNKMLYFEDGQWWIHNLNTNTLSAPSLPGTAHWSSEKYNSLSDEPQAAAVPWGSKGKYIIQEKYDLYWLDLINNSWQKLTDGRRENIKYSIYRSDQDLKNDIRQPIILKMFNSRNYYSGFAYLQPDGSIEKVVYGNFIVKEAWRHKQSLLYTTQSYQQPLEIYSKSKKENKILYKSKGIIDGKLPTLNKEIFQYTVENGKPLNAVLLYPNHYDKNKKYPMVVNVYEDRTREILYYRIPHLQDGMGFNFMHYLYQNYFVLLPDLNYEIGNVGEAMGQSALEAVREACEHANIDKNNIAVVGGSFGGYESTLLIGTTDIFKTAVAGVAVVDLPRTALSYIRNFNQPEFWRVERQQNRMGRKLFGNWQLYLENSPIYHLPKVTQPMDRCRG